MTDHYIPPVAAPKLGTGELAGGYREWCETREQQAPEKYLLRSHSSLLFSIVVPVHNPLEHWLQDCINSVRAQFFENWELILADDGSRQETLDLLKKNQLLDDRISISLQAQPSGISTTTNRAADLAQGDFLVFLDHDDLLDPYALSAFAQRLQAKPEADIIYSDEDRFDENYQRLHPGFKPQFSLEKFLCTNYIHHPVVMRRKLFMQIGGLNRQYDGSQDYDLLLRAIEVTSKIEHIPDVLYHMRIHSGSLASGAEAKPEAHSKGRAAVQAYIQRQQLDAIIKPTVFAGNHNLSYPIKQRPKTSILLLVDEEKQIKESKLNWQQHQDDEILICADISKTIPVRLNQLARKAQGDLLIFANGHLQPEPLCIDELLGHCIRKNTGLVTGKLTYSDGKLHSCGLTLGTKGCAGRWHYSCNADDLGYGGWMGINHEVSAVPWQLLAVKKELFMEAGLFDTQYKSNGFDVHLALQLGHSYKLNHKVAVLAQASFSQPCPQRDELWLEDDFIHLWTQWRNKLNQEDPFYNPNFSIYDESISFISPSELHLKRFGVFNAYDTLSFKLLRNIFSY
ncbi:hypothetical protein AU255_13130 [Methyloprofundus sedimenti]|uniref:Glycosyltransferase 2-like domain-containing protein n=1 Tax=Methyloprofundus sedimenti TaxID=1420851 RepID=A0A1V8M3A9_9GAMM|nr:glycosyltransferase [Methyloprofundus sedimenti]OQK16051.1 hypothetical protein AU255_13130 [Methyloprofundus sedimenti]